MKPLKTILSVFIFSVPMTVVHVWLERKTQLIEYSKRWRWFHTFSILTMTFWLSRAFIASIEFLNQKRKRCV
ncbi:CBO0543 family protein [Bacillus methanolicus]|uniref:CBO0543 family protein n=1 Tax=Bacillus methanolicus TaxID=1471 RepID=UPI000AF868FE|nr:CBO0543 family protein [Bacillus methanolicus]